MIRFKKESYRGGNSRDEVPRWHIAAHAYRKGELYREYVALCGYTIKTPYLTNAMLSFAKKPRGPYCQKCITKEEARWMSEDREGSTSPPT